MMIGNVKKAYTQTDSPGTSLDGGRVYDCLIDYSLRDGIGVSFRGIEFQMSTMARHTIINY